MCGIFGLVGDFRNTNKLLNKISESQIVTASAKPNAIAGILTTNEQAAGSSPMGKGQGDRLT